MSENQTYPAADRLASELAFVGIKAGLNAFLILVRRGLVSPEEVEQFIDGIADHLVPRSDDPPVRIKQIETMRSLIDVHLLPLFAQLRQEVAKKHRQ